MALFKKAEKKEEVLDDSELVEERRVGECGGAVGQQRVCVDGCT